MSQIAEEIPKNPPLPAVNGQEASGFFVGASFFQSKRFATVPFAVILHGIQWTYHWQPLG